MRNGFNTFRVQPLLVGSNATSKHPVLTLFHATFVRALVRTTTRVPKLMLATNGGLACHMITPTILLDGIGTVWTGLAVLR